MAVDCQVSDLIYSSPEPLAHGVSDRWMSVVSCVSCILCRQQLTGPRSAVGNVSGNRNVGHFGHGHFGPDISATDISATENAKGGRFGQIINFGMGCVHA